jgi:CRP/FNR family transcriptional regulator, polysaccharide utilization system transcription regulator
MARFIKNFNCADCNCRSSVFRKLSTSELELINQNRFEVTYRAGEIIFKQGTPSPHYVCITKGLVKIYIEGFGKNLILGLIKPVEYIFGPGIYVDNRHHYSAAAVEESAACLVDVNTYKKLVRENPDFAEEFIQRFSQQAIVNFDQFITLTQKQMHGRIAESLLYLSEKVYCKNPFDLTISRQDLADLSGMSKESSIRILKEFKEEGILSTEGNSITILNLALLKHISQTG